MTDSAYSLDPYRTETPREAYERRMADYFGAAEDARRAAALAAASATQLLVMVTEHAHEQPATTRPADWPDWAARVEMQRRVAEHKAWRAEFDLLARAYVAALDREAAQLPLPGVTR